MTTLNECLASAARQLAAHRAANQIDAVFTAVQGVLITAWCNEQMAQGYSREQINEKLAVLVPALFERWRTDLERLTRQMAEPDASHELH